MRLKIPRYIGYTDFAQGQRAMLHSQHCRPFPENHSCYSRKEYIVRLGPFSLRGHLVFHVIVASSRALEDDALLTYRTSPKIQKLSEQYVYSHFYWTSSRAATPLHEVCVHHVQDHMEQ